MFEAVLMVLVREMPVNAVARLVNESDTRIWRLLSSDTKVDPPCDTNIDPLLVVNPMGCLERRP